MEEEKLPNIEIRNFPIASDTTGSFVVLSLSDGSSGRIAIGTFQNQLTSKITPRIEDGIWWIGSVNTEVMAEGQTPVFRKSDMGIEWKYTNQSDDAWSVLVPTSDIVFKFTDLTAEQRDMITLHYSDLTEAEIAELQRPANDMIAVLEKTNKDVQAAEDARVTEFARLKKESEAATDDAQDTADHPTYVGSDNYVYKWNKDTKTYDKTSVYVRGEAFSIKKVYPSIAAMNADKSTSFKEGDFCLIDTGDVENPDNAKLYVRNASGSWDFLVDMSGAIGFTGKTPQMFIGTVAIGSGKNSAAVTLTSAGTDTDGNPKYNINYVIPCLAYEDLTAEQIAELQRPANDMIAQLKTTEDAVKAAEAARVEVESARVSAENTRKSNEETRKSNESARQTAEGVRENQEDTRQKQESDRQAAENTRVSQEESRVNAEQERVNDYAALRDDIVKATEDAVEATDDARHIPIIKEHTWWVWDVDADEYVDTSSPATSRSPKIVDGIWWTWDDTKGEYTSTGFAANTDFQLTKGGIEGVLTGDIDTHTHDHVRYRAQMYDETPDFTTLTTWSDEQGEHPFLIGNDIYVLNENEPTGYANYRLSPLAGGGTTWVRIPQVAAGWRVVLVKE